MPLILMSVFSNMLSLLPDLNSHSLILGGDFNCCLDPVLDRSSSKPRAPSKSSIYLKSFFSEYGLSDAWRFLNPKKREYSFFSNVHHSYSRIDYFILDNALISRVQSCAYQCIIISDRDPLILDLTFVNLSSHRRNLHFNTSLLADENFISFIADQISFFLSVNKSPDVSDSVVWEALKAYIRGQIISYATTKRKKSKEKQISLANEISRLDEQYAKSPTPDLYKRRLKLKSELDLLSTNEIEGLLRRTRSVFYESGEKSGKVLANQLRGFQAKHIISGLRLDNGEITTDHSAINEKFRDFYSSLYTADSFLRGDVSWSIKCPHLII